MPESPRRDVLADAAIAVLAHSGGRGLTHRAVDRAAGVAEGSTSYYFRTRDSLLRAVVERLAALDTATFPDEAAPGRQGLVDQLVAVVEEVTADGRQRLLARYELTLEATRRPEVGQVLRANARAVRRTVAERLEAAGAQDARRAAQELLVLLDGLLLNEVTGLPERPDRAELRARVDRLVAATGI